MLAELAGLSEEQIQAWADAELDEDTADRMIECTPSKPRLRPVANSQGTR